jgi:deoxyribonuclease-4
MPYFGAHLSIAGGYHRALDAAHALGMQSVQLFTKNNNQWAGKPITIDEANLFHTRLSQHGLRFPTAHDSYLINLASPDEALYQKSVAAFLEEVQRADMLGLTYLVMHPGTPTDGDDEAGLARIADALNKVLAQTPKTRVQILLETTAGQGKSLGWRFEHLAAILNAVKPARRLGVCLDTCHVFAAGYELAPARPYRATMRAFDTLIGLERLKCFHLNDSKKPRGCRVDRHEHLGRGCLGLEPFALLVNDRRFRDLPMILETPKENGNNDLMDAVNLQILRSLQK